MKFRTFAAVVIAFMLLVVPLTFSQAQMTSDLSPKATQSDKALFESANWAMENSDYVEARALLATLIDSHPNSDYVPMAKLAIADAWYAAGDFQQAREEYRDFVTFFPNRPEVAQAQVNLASIQKKIDELR